MIIQGRDLMNGILFRSGIDHDLISVRVLHAKLINRFFADLLQTDAVCDLVIGGIILRFKFCQLLFKVCNLL